MKKAISGILLVGFVICVCACGGQLATNSASAYTAANGYGSGARVMLYATLRAGTSGKEGARLSETAITRPGVVDTGYSRSRGVFVGVGDRKSLSQVEHWLRAQPAVASVRQGPAPAGPPSGKVAKA